MEPGRSTTNFEQCFHPSISTVDEDRAVQQRLEAILDANAQIARERSLFRSDRERLEAGLMIRPIDSRKAFAYFGYMIGTLPPASLAVKAISEGAGTGSSDAIFLILLLTAAVVTGMAGYATGRFVPGLISRVADFRLPNRIALFSLIGVAWGAVSGAAGGLFLFVIGAIFAGIAGGVVGSITVPILILIHDALRRGDLIEIKHFLPIAFGITLSLCALILGF